MTASPQRLPGIGERLVVLDLDGREVSVLRRSAGTVEVDGGEGRAVVLDASAAVVLGAFLTGRVHLGRGVGPRLAEAWGELVVDAFELDAADAAVGRTIGAIGVRRRTGMTVIAILRGHRPIVAPDPDTPLAAGDVLVVVGREADRDGFERTMRDGRA